METDRPRWRSRTWLVAALALLTLALVLGTVGIDTPLASALTLLTVGVLAASVIGWTLRRTRIQRREHEDDVAAWSAERATQIERLRIAGELHDLVSHGLGLITVRAAAARSIDGRGGDLERADALTDIEHLSRTTTTELRRMLTVLRDPGAAPRRPADSLTDLPAIVHAAEAAGLTATLDIDTGEVSPGVQLTLCALVREALTNTLRHAGPTDVHITIHRTADTIMATVRDNGPRGHWQPHPGAGHGLRGIRERIGALNGTLDTTHHTSGFDITAHIPDQEM